MKDDKRVIFITGLPGSGKSTLLADICRKSPQFTIRSNCWFDLPNYKKLEIQDLQDIGGEENTIVGLDEGYTWLESRISGSNLNKAMTYNLFQSRKKGLYFLITAQLAGSIDNRFRQMAEIVIKCKATDTRYKYRVFHVKEKRGRRVLKFQTTITISYEDAEKIYPIFNTWEIIESHAMRGAFLMALTHEKRVEICNGWAKKMNKLKPDWTIGEIKSYLWYEGEWIGLATEINFAITYTKLGLGVNEDKVEILASKMFEQQETWSRPNVKAHLTEIKESQKFTEGLYFKLRKLKTLKKVNEKKIKDLQKKEDMKKQREAKKRLEKEEKIKKEETR